MNDKTDKADYYRKTLENERISRELADKQVLNLLHNIRDRYDIKLNSYMAKNKKKNQSTTRPDENGWGENDTGGWDNKDDDGWGNDDSKTDQQESSPHKNKNQPSTKSDQNGWGDNDDGGWDNKNDEGWGNDDSKTDKPESSSDKKDNSQANSNKSDNKKNMKQNSCVAKNKKKTQSTTKPDENGWGENDTGGWENKDDNGWGNDDSKTDQQESSPHKNKNQPSTKSDQNGWGDNDNGGWGNDDSKTDKPESSSDKKDKKDKSSNPEDKSINQDKNKNEAKKQPDEDQNELKSQLWTTRLDLRLLERDKKKLVDENAAKQKEVDDLSKKLHQANEQVDTLRVKARGLTIDLVAANDEIHKLNERIDEMEADRRSKNMDVSFSESKRKALENKFKDHQQQIANLQSELNLVREEKEESEKRVGEQARRIDRLEADLSHSKKLIRALKDGCTLVESQARAFEVRHDTVVMSKEDLERELIAIKEESSRHITTISKLQKSNEQISKAFVLSLEAHETTKKELEVLQLEHTRRVDSYKIENHRLIEANNQLRKLIDLLQKKR